MSTSSSEQKPGLLARVLGLASATPSGQTYKRWADVDAEIEQVLRLPQSEWMAAAKEVHNETLVHLIRQIRGADQDLAGSLIQELSKRVARITDRLCGGLDPIAAEEIALQVDMHVLKLILSEKQSRGCDFLEVAFTTAIERRTIDAIRRHESSVMGGRRREFPTNDSSDVDDEELERPIELAPDDRPSPEANLLELGDEARRREWVARACDAVQDPHRLEALILHSVFQWPITCKDPDEFDLARHFNATPRRIKYWIAKALEAMRGAIGDQK